MRALRVLVAGVAGALLLSGCVIASEPIQVTSSLQSGTISPGLWRSAGGPDCVGWSQNGTYKGSWQGGGVVDYHNVQDGGPQYVQIVDTDGSFWSQGCGIYWLVGSSYDHPLAVPGQPFGPGDFRVGYEIAPGTYTAPGPSSIGMDCTWQRLRGFTFAPSDIIDSAFVTFADGQPQVTVTVDPHDVGFSSDGCGTWTKTG